MISPKYLKCPWKRAFFLRLSFLNNQLLTIPRLLCNVQIASTYLCYMAVNETSNEVKKSKMERVKKFLRYFRNKYLLTMTLFTLYALFLDDQDMFTLIVQKSKLNKIEADQVLIDAKLAKTIKVLKQLNYTSELERYAREEKLFKKDDEDIFIISNE